MHEPRTACILARGPVRVGRGRSYGLSGSIDDVLNRVNNIASSATPCSTDIFAQYTYLGDGTIVGVAHPAVTGGLNLTYGRPSDSGGGYAALDPASSSRPRRPGPGFVRQTAPACGDAPVRQKHFPLYSLRNSRGFMFQPRLRRLAVVAL